MNYDILVLGSLAYDNILLHKGEFHHRILPENIERLNVSFPIDEHFREFGGTSGNIAHNLKLLGNNPHIVSCLREIDSEDYLNNFNTKGILQKV